jgi:hypothetical protein
VYDNEYMQDKAICQLAYQGGGIMSSTIDEKNQDEILNKEHDEELEKKHWEPANLITPPQDPVYDLYIEAVKKSDDYFINKSGHFCTFDSRGNPFEISNFVARPTMEITRDDGQEVEITLRIEGVLSGGKILPTIDIPISEFPAMKWVLQKWGVGASIKPGNNKKDLCRDAIQSLALNIEKRHIYTHLGFRKLVDGRWIYLYSGGCIGTENISVDIEKALSRYTLPKETKDIKKAALASLALIETAPTEVTSTLLAYTYLTPLLEVFKIAGIEPNFVIWMLGISGSRKTTLGLLYLCHFGNFNNKTPPASFRDTANNIERKAFATKDSLLLIDDYHPESNRADAARMEQTAQKILRMYGDRVARGRLTSTIEFQKEYPPRGNAIITGEDIPKGQSSLARFMCLEILQGEVNLEKLTESQNNSHFLAESMVGYIEWLIPQMEVLPKQLPGIFKNLREKYKKISAHGRLAEMAAWLYIGYRMMLEYMKCVQTISEDDLQGLLKEFEVILKELVEKQNCLLEQEKPADIFIRAISELLATGKVYVENIGKSSNTFSSGNMSGEKIGFVDENFYYLFPETAYNSVYKFLSKRGEIMPVKERTLWKHLDEANLIYVEKEGDGRIHRCPKKNIPNNGKEYRPRVLYLRREAIGK